MRRNVMLYTLVAVIAVFAYSLALAATPEKDAKPFKAKATTNPATTTVTTAPSSQTKKGEVAPRKEPTPQSAQPIEVAIPPTPTSADSIFHPLTSSAVGEQIKWQVVSGGGSQGSSASYKLGSTIGQTATGPASSASYKLNAGFWQNFSNSCCVKEGDCNHSNSVNIVDVTFLVARLFQGGPVPFCLEEADVTDSGTVNIVDLTTLVAFLFTGGSVGVCP